MVKGGGRMATEVDDKGRWRNGEREREREREGVCVYVDMKREE